MTYCDRGFTALLMNKKNFPLKNYYRDTNMNFFDVFNKIHNPDYYYGKENKEKIKENYKHKRKSNPIFKVSD